MKHFAEFVRTTLIGGLLVLFSLFGCVYVLVRIAGALAGFIKPLLSFMPQNSGEAQTFPRRKWRA